jgi:hypothetical protein
MSHAQRADRLLIKPAAGARPAPPRTRGRFIPKARTKRPVTRRVTHDTATTRLASAPDRPTRRVLPSPESYCRDRYGGASSDRAIGRPAERARKEVVLAVRGEERRRQSDLLAYAAEAVPECEPGGLGRVRAPNQACRQSLGDVGGERANRRSGVEYARLSALVGVERTRNRRQLHARVVAGSVRRRDRRPPDRVEPITVWHVRRMKDAHVGEEPDRNERMHRLAESRAGPQRPSRRLARRGQLAASPWCKDCFTRASEAAWASPGMSPERDLRST